ncbi:extracellular serine-threonine rich protein [Nannizzia gypsea CBS 118893]|uniref:Extracellular serine-threonine rich protein n=1 Tax=Arthroderma gypseum (strain ATCC MYA-4604 / CBS 118893) TaxID=535722 RepID=E4V0G9_ARTGP|nr:extracellular serine-threonine rich protein [Nannizzia gypsea CBS 118893]EFR03106.1 extracellular serine-threonine rich protein [Nannizzia gypsea CBS 118893]
MQFTLVVAALAAVASAVTPPNYSQSPSGNPIFTPGSQELVPAGSPYTISWKPTTQRPVSVMLLHGCPKNCMPVATLAEGIPNTGSLPWTPSTSLVGDSAYGLLIVVEGTGEYQYSTNFGIKNDQPHNPPKHSSVPAEKPTWTRQPSAPATHIVVSSTAPASTGGVITLTTSVCPPTSTATAAPYPTGGSSVPGTPQPTGGNPAPVPTGTGAPVPPPAATFTPPPFNNGAGRVGAGVGAALLVVAAAFAL